MMVVDILVFVAAILGVTFVRTRLKASSLAHLDWDDLVSRLQPVPIQAISQIAAVYLRPGEVESEMESHDFWTMIEGEDGLRRLYANAGVLLALASYAQRWNPEGSFVAIERMRRDAMTLRRSVLRLSMGMTLGFDKVQGPFSVQEAASAYFLMRTRLLALYATTHAGRLPQLTAVL